MRLRKVDTLIRKSQPRIGRFLTAAEKKKLLLAMAKRGEARPHARKHPLGSPLGCYTQKSHSCYDPSFDAKIRARAPMWFVSGRKQLLLEMASRGEPRPQPYRHPLGLAVCSYTNKSSSAYDARFHRELKAVAPQWCVGRNRAAKNKKELLALARRKRPRPNCKKHRLGNVLCMYTNRNGRCYDKAFTREIKKLAPEWFKQKESRRGQEQ